MLNIIMIANNVTVNMNNAANAAGMFVAAKNMKKGKTGF